MSKASKFALAATSLLHLRGPDDSLQFADAAQTLPLQIELYGPGSMIHAEAVAWQSNRLVDMLKKRGKTEQTAYEKAELRAEFLSRVTKAFINWGGSDDNGTTTKADFHAVYGNQEMVIIATQAEQHLGETANFIPSSATS
jgi:hypothetical protein